jgi:hypothetical protein
VDQIGKFLADQMAAETDDNARKVIAGLIDKLHASRKGDPPKVT